MITANGKVIETCEKCGKPVTLNKALLGSLHLCAPETPVWRGWCDRYVLLEDSHGWIVASERGRTIYSHASKEKVVKRLLRLARKDARKRGEPKDQVKRKAVRWVTEEDLAVIEKLFGGQR